MTDAVEPHPLVLLAERVEAAFPDALGKREDPIVDQYEVAWLELAPVRWSGRTLHVSHSNGFWVGTFDRYGYQSESSDYVDDDQSADWAFAELTAIGRFGMVATWTRILGIPVSSGTRIQDPAWSPDLSGFLWKRAVTREWPAWQ